MQRLLILGGTSEASALAAALANDTRFDTLLSFAGATRAPRPPPVPYRVGGFGGVAGLAAFLRGQDLMIAATHPFAAGMKANAKHAAEISGIPFLAIQRPPWSDGHEVADMAAAVAALGTTPRRVLLTIGQKDLAAFRAAPWHHYIVRSVDPPAPETLPPGAEVIAARGPFDLGGELALLRGLDVSALVTKNSGGSATQPKVEAARALGIEVIMVARPPALTGMEIVPDAEGALAWLDRHAAIPRRV